MSLHLMSKGAMNRFRTDHRIRHDFFSKFLLFVTIWIFKFSVIGNNCSKWLTKSRQFNVQEDDSINDCSFKLTYQLWKRNIQVQTVLRRELWQNWWYSYTVGSIVLNWMLYIESHLRHYGPQSQHSCPKCFFCEFFFSRGKGSHCCAIWKGCDSMWFNATTNHSCRFMTQKAIQYSGTYWGRDMYILL